LLQVAQAVVSQNELDAILDTIAHLVPILVGVDTCIFYLYDAASSQLIAQHVVAATHSLEEAIRTKPVSTGEFPLLDAVIEHDTPIACPLEDPELPFDQWVGLTQFTLSRI